MGIHHATSRCPRPPPSTLSHAARTRRYRPSVPLAFIATSLAFPSVAEARKLITASGGVLVRVGAGGAGSDVATPSPRVGADSGGSASSSSDAAAATAAEDAAAAGAEDDGDDGSGWALDCKASAGGRITMVRELTAEEAAQAALVAEQQAALAAMSEAGGGGGGGGYGDEDDEDDDG